MVISGCRDFRFGAFGPNAGFARRGCGFAAARAFGPDPNSCACGAGTPGEARGSAASARFG